MKKKLRVIHIDGEKWKWVVESLDGCVIKEVRIYSPLRKMFRVKPDDISNIETYKEHGGDTYFKIEPHMIKNYIIKNLIEKPKLENEI